MHLSPACRIGVDIGGTKIAAALVDDRGRILARRRRRTPGDGPVSVLTAVAELVAELSGELAAEPGAELAAELGTVGVTAIGVGAPGVIDHSTGSVRSATDVLPGWAGTEVRAQLQRLTGLPVAVDNDVRAMALGEARYGAATGYGRVLHVSVGTGVGGALTCAGELVRGPHGTTGEIAHLLVPATGALRCGCGRVDHLEALASGPAIAAAYTARAGGPTVGLSTVVERMRSGDRDARFVVRAGATMLGRALTGLVAALDVDAVVVGGGVAQLGADLLEPMAEALHAEALPAHRDLPVQPALLGTDAPLVGAAVLASGEDPGRSG